VFSSTLAIKCLSVWGGWGAAGVYDVGWDQIVLFAGQFMAISLVNFGFMQILVDQFQQARAQAEHDLLAQRKRTAQVEQHSLDLTQLLREREEIIRQLTLSNKTAGMGALMSSIAHEINQPLTTIVLKTELIQSYLTVPDGTAQVNQLCAQIRDDAHRAGGMIRTLRSMFTVGRGAFEKLDFAAMLRDVADLVRSSTEQQGIALVLDVPASLQLTGDATQLQQVLLNLFNNAIEAVSVPGPASPQVTVQCRLRDGLVELRVQDNGQGIDPAVQRDVFALFKSAAARDMGVGLWLSQAVVESHGGKLDFESTPGQGTVFSLRLPVRDYILGD
jgi:signal transduction histidine kinase